MRLSQPSSQDLTIYTSDTLVLQADRALCHNSVQTAYHRTDIASSHVREVVRGMRDRVVERTQFVPSGRIVLVERRARILGNEPAAGSPLLTLVSKGKSKGVPQTTLALRVTAVRDSIWSMRDGQAVVILLGEVLIPRSSSQKAISFNFCL